MPKVLLPHAGVVEVEGEDALEYLQSQFSQDLSALPEAGLAYGFWLDRKGKVRADSFVLRLGEEHFRLVSYGVPGEDLAELAEANVIADEVEFRDASADWEVWALVDETVAELPPASQYIEREGALLFAGRHVARANATALVPAGSSAAWLDPVAEETLAFLESERVLSGMPAIPQDIGPGDLPQEAGLERAGVSFTKGCYLGQEVMARLHAMGRPQRRLVRVEGKGNGPELPAEVSQGEKSAGRVTSATPLGGGWQGLALLKARSMKQAEESPLMVGDQMLTLLEESCGDDQ